MSPRPAKTLCDLSRKILKDEAEALVRAGIEKGMVSERWNGEYPQNVWAVDESGEVFESQLENKDQGVYHGYPLPRNDNFRDTVIKEWNART